MCSKPDQGFCTQQCEHSPIASLMAPIGAMSEAISLSAELQIDTLNSQLFSNCSRFSELTKYYSLDGRSF